MLLSAFVSALVEGSSGVGTRANPCPFRPSVARAPLCLGRTSVVNRPTQTFVHIHGAPDQKSRSKRRPDLSLRADPSLNSSLQFSHNILLERVDTGAGGELDLVRNLPGNPPSNDILRIPQNPLEYFLAHPPYGELHIGLHIGHFKIAPFKKWQTVHPSAVHDVNGRDTLPVPGKPLRRDDAVRRRFCRCR